MVENHRKISADLRTELSKRKYAVELRLKEFNLKKEKASELVSKKNELAEIKSHISLLNVKLEGFGKNWLLENHQDKETVFQNLGELRFRLGVKENEQVKRRQEMSQIRKELETKKIKEMLVRRLMREEAEWEGEEDETFLKALGNNLNKENDNFALESATQKLEDVRIKRPNYLWKRSDWKLKNQIWKKWKKSRRNPLKAVSYTHLTLPTICSV